MTCKPILTLAAWACLVPAAQAAAPVASVDLTTLLTPASATALAGELRSVLLDKMPDPLYANDSHWGGQRLVADKVKFHIHGLHVDTEVVKALKNDGRWWKVKATGLRLPETLVLDLRDVQHTPDGKATFTAFLAFDARVEYDQENWEHGLRLFSGSAEARLRVNLTLRCEATMKLESNGNLLPEVAFRLRATDAKVGFEHFQLEHIAGVGGDLAKLIGEAAEKGLEDWRPSLEQKLLEKADAAVVKAADTKEMRISVLKLLKAH
ncbi:MAG TPA: hypothetical protein VMS17_16495 [Gemmataceae bacterium]|nr:hypothetical protein [Gemmataceae bacterium]